MSTCGREPREDAPFIKLLCELGGFWQLVGRRPGTMLPLLVYYVNLLEDGNLWREPREDAPFTEPLSFSFSFSFFLFFFFFFFFHFFFFFKLKNPYVCFCFFVSFFFFFVFFSGG